MRYQLLIALLIIGISFVTETQAKKRCETLNCVSDLEKLLECNCCRICKQEPPVQPVQPSNLNRSPMLQHLLKSSRPATRRWSVLGLFTKALDVTKTLFNNREAIKDVYKGAVNVIDNFRNKKTKNDESEPKKRTVAQAKKKSEEDEDNDKDNN